MAFSGSKDFEPNVADYVEEAFERCGSEFRTGYDAVTARRSLNSFCGLGKPWVKQVDYRTSDPDTRVGISGVSCWNYSCYRRVLH